MGVYASWGREREIAESQNDRDQKGCHLVQPPCQRRVTQSRLHRNSSRQVLNISTEGESTTPLDSLFQCSISLRAKKFFPVFRYNFLCFSLCPLPLVLSLGTTEKSLAPSSWMKASLQYLAQEKIPKIEVIHVILHRLELFRTNCV